MLLVVTWAACKKSESKKEIDPTVIGQVTQQMTDVMVHDVTNPPLGARFYPYACLAGYEVIAANDKAYPTMHGVLNDFPEIEKPKVAEYSYQLAAALAMLETAKKMQPSGGLLLKKYQQSLVEKAKTDYKFTPR